MKHIIQFSGGKDSLATLLFVKNKYGLDKAEVIFCDTGWESEKTYQHIKDIQEQIGKKFIILKSKKYKGFQDLAIKKKRFPSTKARFCTEALKTNPFIDWVLEQKEHLIIYQGIRKDESISRSKMLAECSYFRFYFEKKANGKTDTYRKKEIIEWCKNYNADIIRPIFEWTAKNVFDYIKENGFKANPLYYEGFSRVGCFPCIQCVKREIKLVNEKHPDIIEKIRKLELKSGYTFFPPKYIPNRFCTGRDKKGNRFPKIDDVVKYVRDDPNQETFNEPRTCQSVYNICE
jgi:3'-phosphoadenosine 5'-phosphosulfate sulfotransferase (PAPS reductase)/FAD synthetase